MTPSADVWRDLASPRTYAQTSWIPVLCRKTVISFCKKSAGARESTTGTELISAAWRHSWPGGNGEACGMLESASAEHTGVTFQDVEQRINALLHDAWRKLNADAAAQRFYRSIFDRTGEEGFYSDPDRVRGSGEQPTWSPNEAYIQAHERMWQPVDRFLTSVGLRLDAPFRELFYSSREYKDTISDHRRVFFGQFCDEQGAPVTAFMLTVPHSHDEFRFLIPMRIAISLRTLSEP